MFGVLKPILTEKSAKGMSEGLYVLAIADDATKNSVAQDLKRLYGVDVTSVRIVNLPPRQVTFRRHKGMQSKRRKAYIQLKKGQQLPGFEVKKDEKGKKEKGE